MNPIQLLSYQCKNPGDELHVVDGVETDEHGARNEVVLLLDVQDRLDPMPETDGGQGHHGSQDVPILGEGQNQGILVEPIFVGEEVETCKK